MDVAEHLEKNNINKTELCRILGITRSTLPVWLAENKPENIKKIKSAIVQLAMNYLEGLGDGSKISLSNNNFVGKMKDNAKSEVIHNYGSSNESEALRQEIELLKKKLALAEKEIELLNREIELIKK